jgi:hypothetical protein
MEYQWNLVETLVKDIDGYSDVIVGFNARMVCKDPATQVIGVSSVVRLPVDVADLSTFTELEALDKATVEAWATASLTPEQVAQYQAEALADSHFYGSTVKYMPWGAKIK